MKRFATLAAGLVLACLTACQSNQTTQAAPGAVNGNCAASCKGTGCTKDGSCCKASGANCADKAAAPGAVNGEKAGCCKASGASCTDKAAAPGAVSDEKPGCCKSACTGAKTNG
ncbi:MAG: hypothetical protein U0574_07790 [Phycisphaerales bacterium]